MRKYLFIIPLLVSSLFVSGQIANDALTFGQQYHGGTARYMSMGGAFNALGGDFSTLSVNPAGLGIYRSSEFSMTGDLYFNNTTSSINNSNLSSTSSSVEESLTNFNLQSVGYVSHSAKGKGNLVSVNFGIGYNRLKDFNRSYTAEVLGSSHSLTDNWAVSLDGSTTGAYVADQAYLMNRYEDNGNISLASPLVGHNPDLDSGNDPTTVDYIKDVRVEGRINEWVFSLGGNYNDVIYFGATFGLQDIRMEKDYFQQETFLNVANTNDQINLPYVSYDRYDGSDIYYQATDEDYFQYRTYESTSGIGFNGKFGVIVRASDAVRVGLAIHTPTINYLSVNSNSYLYNNTFSINDNGQEQSGTYGEEVLAGYDYRTVSPYKLHASAGFIVGRKLAIDIEGDMVDYSTMKIKDDNGRQSTYRDANNSIEAMYKTAFNGRAGFEFKPVPMFAIRGGFSYYGSPYESNYVTLANGEPDAADYSGDRFDYSAGIGYRIGDAFIDFAYIHSVQEQSAFVFDDAISPYEFYEMDLSQKLNRYMLTFGVKF